MADTAKRRRAVKRSLTAAQVDSQIRAAVGRESKARALGLRAKSARYDEKTKRVVLELSNGIGFAFPARIVRGLERATVAQRAALTLSPSGSAVIWDELNADISVPGVVASTLGRRLAASALGSAGGRSRSAAKAKAAKANGAKGGRPKR